MHMNDVVSVGDVEESQSEVGIRKKPAADMAIQVVSSVCDADEFQPAFEVTNAADRVESASQRLSSEDPPTKGC
jgi:hypothetical protein